MKKFIACLLFLVWPIAFVSAQPAHIITNSDKEIITSYVVLADKGYSIDKIVSDSSLPFIPGDSLKVSTATVYWIKIVLHNPFHYAENYQLWLRPFLNNTLYYLNANTQQWAAHHTGIMAAQHNNSRLPGTMPCQLQANKLNAIFIKTDISALRKYGYSIQPKIILEKQIAVAKEESFIWTSWLISLSILLLFFLNNLYIYYSFRDKTVLYYLLVQFGGMIYITAHRQMFTYFFPDIVFSYTMLPDGSFYYYNLINVAMHVSVLLIVYGTIELSRCYLNSSKTLPQLDRLLRYGKYIYTIFTISLLIINTCFVFVDEFVLLYDNILFLLLIALVLFTGVMGYKKRLPSSGAFLLANVLPMLLMLAVALRHVIIGFANTGSSVLPDLVIITQAVIFSIALVARIKLIRKALALKEMEAKQLAFDIRELELLHELAEMKHEQIEQEIIKEKNRNELLQEKLEANERELASTSLYIVQKNELLASLKTQIKELNTNATVKTSSDLKSIESILQSNFFLDDDWNKFKLHFEKVHPDFFKELKEKHPSLTKNEIRLYTYFHLNLSTKEIAALLNIDPASVRTAKTRLNKKING